MAWPKTLENTPLGCQVVFALTVFFYLLATLDHHAFIGLNLACRPVDIIYGLQVQRLVLASLVHTSLPGLLLALGVCHRRFAWLEHQTGSLGFLVWFVWISVLLHTTYCLGALCLAPFIGPALLLGEVHGLFPVLTATLVASIKDSDNATVWLWPFPFHVPVKFFPLVVIALSWLLHWEAHFDVVAAYCLAATAPTWVTEPAPEVLDWFEKTLPGMWLLHQLQNFDSFVCRPPSAGGTMFRGEFSKFGGDLSKEPVCDERVSSDFWRGRGAAKPPVDLEAPGRPPVAAKSDASASPAAPGAGMTSATLAAAGGDLLLAAALGAVAADVFFDATPSALPLPSTLPPSAPALVQAPAGKVCQEISLDDDEEAGGPRAVEEEEEAAGAGADLEDDYDRPWC